MRKKKGLMVSMFLVLAGLAYLMFGSFGENLVYFATPSEVTAFPSTRYGKKIRVGGMVVEESLRVIPNSLKMSFDLTDGADTISVAFEGIPPDLFKEGQGAVVEGYWEADRIFHSRMIMAKHSEDYMPIQMKKGAPKLPKKDFFKTLQLE